MKVNASLNQWLLKLFAIFLGYTILVGVPPAVAS